VSIQLEQNDKQMNTSISVMFEVKVCCCKSMHSVHNVNVYHHHHHTLFNFVFSTLDDFHTSTVSDTSKSVWCIRYRYFVQEAVFYITDNGNCTCSRVYIGPIQTEVKFVKHHVAWIHTSVLS